MCIALKFTTLLPLWLVAHRVVCVRTEKRESISQQGDPDNRSSRGMQTFDSAISSSKTATGKHPLPSHTMVDWKTYYPFVDKMRLTDQAEGRPVYVKVPIRVPVKAEKKIVFPYRLEKKPGKKLHARKVRKSISNSYKMPLPVGMGRPYTPDLVRRKLIAYYNPNALIKRKPVYVIPKYQKMSIHDLYKKNMYYPFKGGGYQVKENDASYLANKKFVQF